jgi:hypothetical protein
MIHLFEEIYIKSRENTEQKPLDDLLEDAKKAYQYLLDGNRFWTNKGTPVRFSERGFNELFFSIEKVMGGSDDDIAATKLIKRNKHCLDDLLNTVSHLQDIVENMEFKFYQKNFKPEKKPDLRGYEYYECPVVIDGKKKKIRLAFEKRFKDKDKTAHYYYHYLAEAQRPFEIVIVDFELI